MRLPGINAPSSGIDAGNNLALPPGITFDLAGNPRLTDHPDVIDTGVSTNGQPVIDMGAFEWSGKDCNDNGIVDSSDIAGGTSTDCNSNAVPDECEADCDSNGVIDACELVGDINHDGVVDAADLDGYLACMTGPCGAPPCVPALYADECCVVADGDADGDVDLLDFRHWQHVFDRVCGVDGDCDDGLFCSGVETCVDGLCQRGEYPCTDPVNSFCLEDVDGCTYPPLPGMAEDFEGYACGEQSPAFWVDTEADGSLVVNDALFDVGCLGNAQALHTASTATNVHSHYTELGSADWSSITYTGRMMYTAFTGGVGVTFMSQYPSDGRYYRLRRHQWTPTFHISPSPGVEIPVGTLDTGVSPTRNVWYRYAIETTDTGTQTEIRAKVWRDGDPEPAAWQADCYDASPSRLTHGTVGVWSMGDGDKYWDDLAVIASQP